MYNLLNYHEDGPVLYFTFAIPNDGDHEWHHSALVDPIVHWFRDSLYPLAGQLGERLTEKDIIGSVCDLAEKDLLPPASVDWLGLALFSLREFAVTVGELSEKESPELEKVCSQKATLAERLCRICEEFGGVLEQKIQFHQAEAA